jgi:hypothetical protein
MTPRLRIKLNEVHERSGLSFYRVAKDTGLPMNTVMRYGKEVAIMQSLSNSAIILCNYYGVDWRDPSIVEMFEDEHNPEAEAPALEMA